MSSDKKRKTFSISLFTQIAAAVILLLLLLLITLSIVNYKIIFRHFLSRELDIKSISFDRKSGTLHLESVTFSDMDNNFLFRTDKLSVSINLSKTLTLRPTLNKLHLDNPETFIIKKGSEYSLPDFFQKSKETGKQFKSPVRFTINEVIITGGKIRLFEKEKFHNFITDITIKLPAITSEIESITPEITGRINNKLFSFKGKTTFGENNEISNHFDISLRGLDLEADRIIVPVMPGFKLEKGIIDINANLKYDIDRRKKTSISIKGNLSARNLTVSDSSGEKIISGMSGSVAVNNYDISKSAINIERMNINSGTFNFPDAEKVDQSFKANISAININKLNLNFRGIEIRDISGTLKNISSDNIEFNVKGNIHNNGDFSIEGKNKSGSLTLDKITLRNIDPFKISLIQKNDNINSVFIKNFSGQTSVTGNEIILSGEGELNNLKVTSSDLNLNFPELQFNITEFNSKSKFIEISRLKISNSSFKTQKSEIADINALISPTASSIKFPLEDKNDFIGEIPVEYLNFRHKSWTHPYTAVIENALINANIKSSKSVYSGSLSFDIDSAKVNRTNMSSSIIINKISGNIENFNTLPLRINCRNINSDYIYARMDIREDMSVLFGGILDLAALSNDSTGNNFFHLGNLSIKDGNLALFDSHLTAPLFFDFSGININLNNYPSYIYPTGNLSLSGKVDAVNPFKLDGIFSKTGITGNFSGENFLLFRLSPYMEHYLNHRITGGRLDIKIPFSTNSKETKLNISLLMKKPVVERTGNAPLNLRNIFNTLEERDGSIKLELPVTIDKKQTRVDYFALVFDVMKNTLRLTADRIINPLPERIRYNQAYSIGYFNPGSTVLSNEKILDSASENMISDRNIVYVLSSFVDRLNDTEYLKRETAARLEERYKSQNRVRTLKDILEGEYGETALDNLTESELFNILLAKITIRSEDFYALSYSRSKAAKDILIRNYRIPENRIFIEENDIFTNPYISGIPNNITIIRTGRVNR